MGFALWVRLLTPLFAKVKVDPRWLDRVRAENERGLAVHVVEVTGLLDCALLSYLLRKHELPAPSLTNTRSVVWLKPLLLLLFYPFIWLFNLIFRRRDQVAAFTQGIAAGRTGLVFLKRGRFVMVPGGNIGADYLKAMVGLQRKLDKPITLLPQVIFWTPSPEKYHKGIVELLIGGPTAPGPRKLLSLVLNPSRGLVTCGEPVSIDKIIEENPDSDDEEIARTATWTLHRAIDGEEKIVRGPLMKTAAQVKNEMMSNPEFVGRVEELGAEAGMSAKAARRRAAKCIKEVAADFRIGYIEFFCIVLTPIFKRVFSSFVVDRDAINTIREESKNSTVVLVPCHRSHIDYLIISYLLYLQGVIPPHIAAGANLSFFPMGHLFRHSGAFFIRRKVAGDSIYGLTLSRYIRKLLKEGHSMEFFIEGGRSRTGKTLPPRFGLLNYIADAICDGTVRNVTIIPLALSYERIMEVESYTRELAGKDKQKEDLTGLVKSAQVLDSRYGRLYLTAGRPIRLAEFMQKQLGKPASELTDEEKRYLITKVGYLILTRINGATVVNPSGLVACTLLSHHRRGMSMTRFLETAGFLLDVAAKRGYPISITLERAAKSAMQSLARAKEKATEEGNSRLPDLARGRAISSILEEALEMFGAQGYVASEQFDDEAVISVMPHARIFLNYYRNNVIHVYQREALVALSLYSRNHQPKIRVSEVEDDTQFLSKLFKKEFIFRVGDFERGILAALIALEKDDIVRRDDNGCVFLVPENLDRLLIFRNMVLPIVESYLVCARYAPMVRWKGAQRSRDLARAVLNRASKDYREGEVTCQEALSTVSLQNALARYVSMDVLKTVDSGIDAGKIRFARGSALENLRQIELKLTRFVDVK